jgi:hypothetical protein
MRKEDTDVEDTEYWRSDAEKSERRREERKNRGKQREKIIKKKTEGKGEEEDELNKKTLYFYIVHIAAILFCQVWTYSSGPTRINLILFFLLIMLFSLQVLTTL